MLTRESPRSLTKDIIASMMAMKPAKACSLPCAVNTGRPETHIMCLQQSQHHQQAALEVKMHWMETSVLCHAEGSVLYADPDNTTYMSQRAT